MKDYAQLTKEELLAEKEKVEKVYKDYQAKGLKLDMSRGKPSPSQHDKCMPILDALSSKDDYHASNGFDVRNYGLVDGIPDAKELMAEMMDTRPENIILGGNASLNLMYDCVCRGYCFGIMGSTPWHKLDKVKFLCPVPGYDRHFGVTEQFGIEMINIPMNEDGPDMDMVEKYVNNDDAVKGIWCVPKFSNPGGVVYSDEVVRRFANLQPAAKDFRIYWDNAYVVHYLYDEEIKILDIISECEKAGNPDMVYEFASTSKISFAGAGISAMATSQANIEDIKKSLTKQTIGPDKVNQLRHVRYFKDLNGILDHMKLMAEDLRPRFELVCKTLDEELSGLGVGTFTNPKGGYFIMYTTLPGCATRVIELCKEAGVVMTGAGAPFPYHKDPEDSTIRISPSYPSIEDLGKAAKVFTVCVKLATIEHLLGENNG
ncbi:MAG: aminotransferase [Lachnospiraceae bacterium]|nr:aminotransferase [Lachnospiraceae bacterium]